MGVEGEGEGESGGWAAGARASGGRVEADEEGGPTG